MWTNFTDYTKSLEFSSFFIFYFVRTIIYIYGLHDNPNRFPSFLAFPILLMSSSSFLPCHQKYHNEKKSLWTSLCKYISGLYFFFKNYDWINENENYEFKVYFDWGLRKRIENLSPNIDKEVIQFWLAWEDLIWFPAILVGNSG